MTGGPGDLLDPFRAAWALACRHTGLRAASPCDGDDLVSRLAATPSRLDGTHPWAGPGTAATEAAKLAINEANLEALEREIRAARALSAGQGILAINVIRAVSEYSPSVTRALECGIDAVVVGAGLPLDLPDLAQARC